MIFPNLKEIAISAEKANYPNLKGGGRTTLTQFRAAWRPVKAIFPNLIETTFSSEKAIFPNLKGDAFGGRQNNLDAISSVLATWKSEFS